MRRYRLKYLHRSGRDYPDHRRGGFHIRPFFWLNRLFTADDQRSPLPGMVVTVRSTAAVLQKPSHRCWGTAEAVDEVFPPFCFG